MKKTTLTSRSVSTLKNEFVEQLKEEEQLNALIKENFVVAINRAIDSCKTQGISVDDHFREVTKMVSLGSGAQRPVQDFMLTRYACI